MTSEIIPGSGGDQQRQRRDIALDFLKTYFANYHNDEAWVGVHWFVNGNLIPEWRQLCDLDSLSRFAAQDRDIYFTACPRRDRPDSGRGTSDDIDGLPALWADLDIFGPAHKANERLPKSRDDVRALLERFEHESSLLANTGGGYQAYWLFDEPVTDPAKIKSLLARCKLTWESIAGKMGFRLDNVWDAARILRLPGTVNHKDGLELPLVTFMDYGHRYGPTDLAESLDDAPSSSSRGERVADDIYNDPELALTHGWGRFDAIVGAQGVLRMIEGRARGSIDWVRQESDGDQHYHYSLAEHENSVTVFHDNHLIIWSETLAVEFPGVETGHPYRPNEVWTLVAFNGQWSESGRWFAQQYPEGTPEAQVATSRAERSTSRLTLVRASLVSIDRPTWVWDRRIPVGGTTFMVGREGLGKTLLVCWHAALLSKGMLPGHWFGRAADVIYVGVEDDRSTVLVPRLIAAGADLDRFHFVDFPKGGTFSVNVDVTELTRLAKGLDTALVVVDPLDSHLGPIDSHKKAEVQAAVGRLAELAQDVRCGAVGLGHFNKSAMKDVLQRVVGSVGFTTAARSVLGVGENPQEPDERLCVLAKASMTDKASVAAVRFKPEKMFLDHPDGGFIDTARANILGELQGVDPNAILMGDPEERSATMDCADWLHDFLSDGPKLKEEVESAATREGFSPKVLRLARTRLRVIVDRDETKKGRPSTWRLPDPE